VGQFGIVAEEEGRTSQSQMWSTGTTVCGDGSVPKPSVGRCSGGKGLGIMRLLQHHPVEMECE